MKVILLQDVANVGKRFDVAEVPNGHALNMLIPRGMAEAATPENLKRVEARKSKQVADQTAVNDTFAQVAEKISGTTQEAKVELNDQGGLYEGLKAEGLAVLLNEAGFSVTADQVVLPDPIKEAGEHSVTLAAGEQTVTFTLNVIAK